MPLNLCHSINRRKLHIMPFKDNWESTDQYFRPERSTIEAMLSLAFQDKKLHVYHILSGGCANLNIKIQMEGETKPLILRIYLRDQDAAYREQKIALLVKDKIPVPDIYYIGDYANYRFAIAEYLVGIQLRTLLLSQETYDLASVMYDIGKMLATFQNYQFQNSGFFNRELKPIEILNQEDYVEFAKNCLTQKIVRENIDTLSLEKINFLLVKNQKYFPSNKEHNLVHADFDPANILVSSKNGTWKISGILDWEFAFSGSSLCDLANMLRYAHAMPANFTDAFLEGLKDAEFHLPETWQTSIHMLNLVALLDCLLRTDSQLRPKQLEDICSLIHNILKKL